jgi:hypothetical protein
LTWAGFALPGATIDGHGLGRTPWHPAGYVLVLP